MPWKRIGKWLWANKVTAAIIAIVCWLALSNALGGPGNLIAKKYLDLARGWYQAHQSQKAAWDARETEWSRRATEARGKLAAARKPAARPAPTSAAETAARFRELGYTEARVR